MVDGWLRKGLIIMVLVGGIMLGRMAAVRSGHAETRTAQNDQLHKDLFEAVRSWLAAAHVPQQDMPKRIISVEVIGPQRYRVQMEMVVGVGWFEVWQEGGEWKVKGLPVPPGAGGGGGGG